MGRKGSIDYAGNLVAARREAVRERKHDRRAVELVVSDSFEGSGGIQSLRGDKKISPIGAVDVDAVPPARSYRSKSGFD
jgi:hypothetical protein